MSGRGRTPCASKARLRRAVRSAGLGICIALALALALGLVPSQPGLAEEPRVLRVVGVQPLDASAAKAGGPRQGAVNVALYEAVSRVALELVDEYGPPVPAEGNDGEDGSGSEPVEREEGWLKQALGQDMTPFARSFRIVDDQGSRPVLFPGETSATREYVVVVEATVDVERVRERLAAKGVIALEEEESAEDGVEIEALGLRHWSGYEALVALLEGPDVRASEVRPLEFEAGRTLVFAVVRGTPEDVLERLLAAAPDGLRITDGEIAHDQGAEGRSAARIQLRVLWTPPRPG